MEIEQEQSPGRKYDFDVELAKLLEFAPAPNVVRLRSTRPIKTSERFAHLGHAPSLALGIDLREAPPLKLEPILAECPLFKEAYETHGADETNFANPVWNLINLATTFMENGRELAHSLGDKHPTYSHGETEQQWERKDRERRDKGLGWPSCRAISDAGATHCRTCPHLAEGRSQLHFAYDDVVCRDGASDDSATPEEQEKEAEGLGAKAAPELRLPKGYKLNDSGQICAFIPTQIKGRGAAAETIPGQLLPIFFTRFSDISLRHRDGYYGLRFIATMDADPKSAIEVFLNELHCYDTDQMGQKHVRINPDDKVKGLAVKFAASWLEQLMSEDVATHDQGTMGWHFKEDRRVGFAYGKFLYHEDGSLIPIVLNADEKDFNTHYSPQGKREPWLYAAKLLTDRKRPELDLIIAVAFAAPLATFLGTFYGAILSIWGDPGTAKSTAQMVAAAVWGHPKQTRESLTSTAKSIQGRLGRTRNLPAYWDDVQDERHQQALFDTMFVAAEGAEGGRLNADSTYKKRLEWQTLMVACSNASFVGFLTEKQNSTTAGIRRVFEIVFRKRDDEVGMINPLMASQAFSNLERNYGVIGSDYAQLLARNHVMIGELVTDITNAFREKVNGTIEESYWWGCCGLLLSGAMLANKLGVELDVMAMETLLVEQFQYNKDIRSVEGAESGTRAHMETWLGKFINEHAGGNLLHTDITRKNRDTQIEVFRSPAQGRPLYVHVVRDECRLFLSKKAMRKYFQEEEVQSKSVFDDMKRHLNAVEVKLTLGAGTVHAGAQEWLYSIPLRDDVPLLRDLMYACGKPKTSSV